MMLPVRFVWIGLASLLVAGAQSATSDWTIFLRRAGPLRIGTPINDVRRIIGEPGAHLLQALRQTQALPREPDDSGCAYLVSTRIPESIGLMFQEGRLARVDVRRAGVRTASGAQVGDTEARIVALYGPKIRVQPHKYVPTGHYLIYTPADEVDRDYQMLFETEDGKVTQFRAGLRKAVEQVEGCA